MSISWVGLWPQGSDWSPGLQKLHSLTVATLAMVILLKILTKAFICSVSFLTYTSVLWMLNVKNFTGNLHVILIKKQFPSHYSLLFVYILRHSLMWPQVTSNSWSSHVLDLETHSTTPGFPCSQFYISVLLVRWASFALVLGSIEQEPQFIKRLLCSVSTSRERGARRPRCLLQQPKVRWLCPSQGGVTVSDGKHHVFGSQVRKQGCRDGNRVSREHFKSVPTEIRSAVPFTNTNPMLLECRNLSLKHRWKRSW